MSFRPVFFSVSHFSSVSRLSSTSFSSSTSLCSRTPVSKRHNNYVKWLVAAFSGLLMQSAVASTELDKVTVTASRTGQLAEALPAGSLILTDRDIQRMPARNLAEVLDTLGGVSATRTYGINASRSSIDLLGFGPNASQNTLILLNGRRLNDLDLSATDFAAIPLAAIARIEVLPGTGAVLHGSGASGGVINIVTHEAHPTGAGLTLTGGSFATRGADLWSAASDSRSGIMVAGQALNSDGYRENNAVKQRNGFISARHQQNNWTSYLTLMADDQQMGLPGNRQVDPDSGLNQLRDDPRGTASPDDWADQQGLHIQPGIVWHFEHLDLYLEGARRHKGQQFFFAGFSAYQERELDQYSFNPRATGVVHTGNLSHHWTLGLDFSVSRFEMLSASNPDDTANPNGFANIRQQQQGFYVQSLSTLGERVNLQLGVREERLSIKADQDNPFTGAGQADRKDSYTIAEAGLSVQLADTLTAFTNTARTARIPNADELSPQDGDLLKPQTGLLHTAGLRWRNQHQYSVLTLWQGDYSDEIIYDPNTFSNVNLDDDTRRRGASLSSRFRLDDRLVFSGSATVQQAHYRGGPFRGNDLVGVPEHHGYLQLNWQALNTLAVVVSQRYTGERRFGGDETNTFERKISSYTWTDLVIRGGDNNVHWSFGVYNLQDKLAYDSGFVGFNESSFSVLPLPGRHYMVSAGVTF